jgi:hypothetical protein
MLNAAVAIGVGRTPTDPYCTVNYKSNLFQWRGEDLRLVKLTVNWILASTCLLLVRITLYTEQPTLVYNMA